MKIIIYPYYTNPYQDLLVAAIKKVDKNSTLSFLKPKSRACIDFMLPLLIYRKKGYTIFHLHWQDFKIGNGNFSQSKSFINAVLVLFLIKLFGFRLVWTVHNVIPHEKQTVNDLLLTKIIVALSDKVIIHSAETKKEFLELGILVNDNKYELIKIGNYNSIYKNTNLKPKKNSLILAKNELNLLHFGMIRPYKNIEGLISALKRLGINRKKVNLIIAGQPLNKTYADQIQELVGKNDQIKLDFRFISDRELSSLFNQSDAVVLPFHKLTTSSSVLVAFAFKKPVIAPEIGNIADFPASTGIYYNSNDYDALYNALLTAVNSRKSLKQMGQRGYEFASTQSWEDSAVKTLNLYQKLL